MIRPTRLWGNKVLASLTHPTYVIRMGQMKPWSKEAKVKWLRILQQACKETIQLCHEEIERITEYE